MDEDTGLMIVVIGVPFLVCGFFIALVLFDSPDIRQILLLSIAAVFAIIGIVQLSGRGAWFVAGYNTMTQEEKAQYDPKAIARGSAVIMFGIAAFIALISFDEAYLVAALLVLVMGIVLGTLVMRRLAGN